MRLVSNPWRRARGMKNGSKPPSEEACSHAMAVRLEDCKRQRAPSIVRPVDANPRTPTNGSVCEANAANNREKARCHVVFAAPLLDQRWYSRRSRHLECGRVGVLVNDARVIPLMPEEESDRIHSALSRRWRARDPCPGPASSEPGDGLLVVADQVSSLG